MFSVAAEFDLESLRSQQPELETGKGGTVWTTLGNVTAKEQWVSEPRGSVDRRGAKRNKQRENELTQGAHLSRIGKLKTGMEDGG